MNVSQHLKSTWHPAGNQKTKQKNPFTFVVFLPKTHDHSADKAKLRDSPHNTRLALFRTVKATKHKGRLKTCRRPERAQEA